MCAHCDACRAWMFTVSSNTLNGISRSWGDFHFVPLKGHIYVCPMLTIGYMQKVAYILVSVDICRVGKTGFCSGFTVILFTLML